jgi:hypothetical protein
VKVIPIAVREFVIWNHQPALSKPVKNRELVAKPTTNVAATCALMALVKHAYRTDLHARLTLIAALDTAV